MSNLVPLDWVKKHSAGAMRQGVDFDSLMASSLIQIEYGDNRDLVSPAQWLLLCLNTSIRLDDATHGLARSGFASGFTLVGLRSVKGCVTLEAAIRTVQHLYSLTSRSIRIELSTTNDHAILSVEADCETDQEKAVLEDTYLSWIYMHCMYFLGRPFPVLSVTTSDISHFNIGRLHYAIGAPTRHGRYASMRFAKSLLAQRGTGNLDENPHWECFRLWLDSAKGLASERSATGPEVHAVPPRIGELAMQSGVSRATVYRRLLATEGGARLQRQRALTDSAVRLLRETNDCVESISAELGYADARSLRRFLKTTTGKTPKEIRESALQDSSDANQRARQRLQKLCTEKGW